MAEILSTPIPLWLFLLYVAASGGLTLFFRSHADRMYDEAQRYAGEAGAFETELHLLREQVKQKRD